jgi:hypothetical protein
MVAVNGKARDSISADISAGLPTLSKIADSLAMKVSDLVSPDEQERFWGNSTAGLPTHQPGIRGSRTRLDILSTWTHPPLPP